MDHLGIKGVTDERRLSSRVVTIGHYPQRDGIERLAYTRFTEHVDFQLPREIPGIGPINALNIVAEVGDLRRLDHHCQFLKFCGFDLATCQSGTSRVSTDRAKYGNARLGRTFWMAAKAAARQRENIVRDKLKGL